MSYPFNADEIFEVAIQLERNGQTFYRSAAKEITDSKQKELLLNLAAMEEEHEQTFIAMRNELTDAQKVSTVFDPEGEIASYLRSLADIRIFFKKEINLTSLEEILKAAILAEKDSIVFYLGMKDVVPPKLGQAKIDSIIKEEMSHVRLLSRELTALHK
ncbi:MAG: ferritin-like domain-containing protein [Candidatus Helarchaeota archaeon]